jgi:hypothetical protein
VKTLHDIAESGVKHQKSINHILNVLEHFVNGQIW